MGAARSSFMVPGRRSAVLPMRRILRTTATSSHTHSSVAEFRRLGAHELAPTAAQLARAKDVRLSSGVWNDIMQVFLDRLPEMSAVDVSAACSSMARVYSPLKTELYAMFADRLEKEVELLQPKDLARTASGLIIAKLPPLTHTVYTALETAAIKSKEEFQSDSIQQLLNAFSQVRLGDGRDGLFESFAPVALEWSAEFYPMELALIANAYARAGVKSPDLFRAIGERLSASTSELRPRDISMLANAFAKLSAPKARLLFDALASEAALKIEELEPKHMASISFAFSRLHHNATPGLLNLFAERIVRNVPSSVFSSQELVNLLSAYAKVRSRPKEWLCSLVEYLEQNDKVVLAMSPVDLLYTASSLARLNFGSRKVFESLATAVLQLMSRGTKRPSQLPTAKQIIYLLHAFAQAGHPHSQLFQNIAGFLQGNIEIRDGPGTKKRHGPSKSDWVVAYGAYVDTGLHSMSPETRQLCSDVVRHCCDSMDAPGDFGYASGDFTNSGMTPMDVSHLLRSLSKGFALNSEPSLAILLAHVLRESENYSPTELLVALHAVVQLREAYGELVPLHTYNAFLSLISCTVAAGRLSNLNASDLITASSLLGRTSSRMASDGSAWSSLCSQMVDLLNARVNRQVDGEKDDSAAAWHSDKRSLQIQECLIVVLNNAARVGFQDMDLLQAAYKYLAAPPTKGGPNMMAATSGSTIVAAALTKLGAGSRIEAVRLGLPMEDFTKAWKNILGRSPIARGDSAASPAESSLTLSTQALRCIGLACAAAGGGPTTCSLSRALRADALASIATSTVLLQDLRNADRNQSTNADVLASCSQILSLLQSLFLLCSDSHRISLSELRNCKLSLDAVEGPLFERGTTRYHPEPELAAQVVDMLERVCAHPLNSTILFEGKVPQLRTEIPVAQYFVDVALQPSA